MSSNRFSDGSASLSSILIKGAVIGIAGGLAEVAVIAMYGLVAHTSVANVGGRIASVVGLDATSAWTGLAVHMVLAVALGIALMAAWRLTRPTADATSLYVFVSLMLATVWVINFFVVLPVLSSDFVTLLPYSVTLFSKLMFGLAAAASLRTMSGARRDGLPASAVARTLRIVQRPERAHIKSLAS